MIIQIDPFIGNHIIDSDGRIGTVTERRPIHDDYDVAIYRNGIIHQYSIYGPHEFKVIGQVEFERLINS